MRRILGAWAPGENKKIPILHIIMPKSATGDMEIPHLVYCTALPTFDVPLVE